MAAAARSPPSVTTSDDRLPLPSTSRSNSSISTHHHHLTDVDEMQRSLTPLSPIQMAQPPTVDNEQQHQSISVSPQHVPVNPLYDGSGTSDDPFIVKFTDNDAENPMNFSDRRKLIITFVTSISTLVVSFDSSAYSGAINELHAEFAPVTNEILTLGISLYVLGFALGPLCWGPLSEVYGRRKIFYFSYIPFICFLAAACGTPNVTALVIFRFLQGTFGSSPITNSGGTISDMYAANERGNALSVYSISVFCGPILGKHD